MIVVFSLNVVVSLKGKIEWNYMYGSNFSRSEFQLKEVPQLGNGTGCISSKRNNGVFKETLFIDTKAK